MEEILTSSTTPIPPRHPNSSLENWDEIGLSIRSANDIMSKLVKIDNLSEKPAKQFATIFNHLFPKDKIEYLE